MAAPTEPPVPCPVCVEPLTGRPERCFRCETALEAWWGFEEALAGTELGEKPVVPVPVPAPLRTRLALFSTLAVTAALGVGLFSFHASSIERPVSIVIDPTPPPTPAPTPTPAPAPRIVHYRVQRGDSLWRIAASLTGDGTRWKELWPDRTEATAQLAVGSVLEVDLSRMTNR